MINRYLLATVCLTAYFQLMLRWRMSKLGQVPEIWHEKLLFVGKSLFDPFIISAFAVAVIAAVCWMTTLTKLQLNTAYPIFLSLSILTIVTLSTLLLKEPFSAMKCIGVALIFSGLWFVNSPL